MSKLKTAFFGAAIVTQEPSLMCYIVLVASYGSSGNTRGESGDSPAPLVVNGAASASILYCNNTAAWSFFCTSRKPINLLCYAENGGTFAFIFQGNCMSNSPGLPLCAEELRICRDAIAELQGFVATLFMTLMPSAAARNKMRLSGVSQPLLPDATVWYFWREDFPGVFSLQLGEADLPTSGVGRRARTRGRFWIKYYPALEDDKCFEGLSLQEQALRLGPLFDATGTPVLETWSQIPEAAFHVGYLELERQEEEKLIRLECTAHDVWQSHCTIPVDVEHCGTIVRLLESGDVDRNLPGWPLAWPMMDTMTTALGLFYASAPIGGLLWEEPAQNGTAARDKKPIVYWMTLYLPCETTLHSSTQWDAFSLLQKELDTCEREQGNPQWLLVQPPDAPAPWLNLFWWQASTEQDLADAGLCCLIGHDTDTQTQKT